jgi:hypothetical protein
MVVSIVIAVILAGVLIWLFTQQEQLRAAKERALNKLMQTAIVTPDPPNIAPVVEMAMQKYPQWAAK